MVSQLLSSDWHPKPEEAQVLRDFIVGNTSVHTAAGNFLTVATSAGRNSEKVGEALYGMWYLVVEFAQDFPEIQDRGAA